MKLQQLRYICEVAKHHLNVSATASHLYTSQPGISKQIRLLEDELGIEIFARSGKHLVRVTPAGEVILEKAAEILREVESIKRIAEEYSNQSSGQLSIATTHTQVRYVLPEILSELRARYPGVSLHMRQGTTEEIGELATAGEVDFAITPERVDRYPELVMMPCYHWNRCVVVPKDHALAGRKRATREDLEAHPIVTYDSGFRERLPLVGEMAERPDEEHHLNIAMSAVDTDVIKTYVRQGFGVGVIAGMAYDPASDADLVAIDASDVFNPSTTYIGCRKGTFLRRFMLDFIELFAPHLDEPIVRDAFAAHTATERRALFDGIELPHR